MKTRRLSVSLLLLGAVLLSASTAIATVYKCTGADGRLYFTDRPCPPETKATRVEIDHATRVESGEPAPPVSPPLPEPPTVQEGPQDEQPGDVTEDSEAPSAEEAAEAQEETPAEQASDQ